MKLPRIESRLVELLVEEYFAWLDKKPEEVNEGIKKKLNLLLNYLDEERRSEVFRKVDFEITGQYHKWRRLNGFGRRFGDAY